MDLSRKGFNGVNKSWKYFRLRVLGCLQEKEEGLRYANELLQRLSLQLEQPLTWEVKRELVEALVEQIRVDTGEDSRGKKEAKVIVTYRFGPSTAIGMGKDSLMPLA
jgi:hypothetical protein